MALACTLGLLGAVAVHAAPLPVELVSPSAGRVWDAGETIQLEWRLLGEWPAPSEIEEWEAFLSVDGGRSFAVRLTPHLGADLRGVRVTVPTLPTEHARLLLRFGNERREIEWAVPGEFTIRSDRSPMVAVDGVAALQAERRGEAARAGDPGVVLWAEGRRDGGDWRAARAVPAGGFRPAVEPGGGTDETVASEESPSLASDDRRLGRAAFVSSPAPRRFSPRSRRGVSVLRLVERLNE